MLKTRQLSSAIFLYLSAIFLLMPASLCQAIIYKATFPNHREIYFSATDSKMKHQYRLNPDWFNTNTNIEIDTLTPEELSSQELIILGISGGLELGYINTDFTLFHNVHYALEMFSTAMECPGFNRILKDPSHFNQTFEQKLTISIDAAKSGDIPDIMHRAAGLADLLVDKHEIDRWQPELRFSKKLNEISLSLILPRIRSGNSEADTNDKIFKITRQFLEEFKTNKITFDDQASGGASTMSRPSRIVTDTENCENFEGRILATLAKDHLDEINYNPFYPHTRWHAEELFIIRFTIEDSDEGFAYLRDKITTLTYYLNGKDLAYSLNLRRIYAHPYYDNDQSALQQGSGAQKAEIVMELVNFIPSESLRPRDPVKRRSLGKVMLIDALNSTSTNDEKVLVDTWEPVRLRVYRYENTPKKTFFHHVFTSIARCLSKTNINLPSNFNLQQMQGKNTNIF